jgi:hypothetical protein
VPDFYYLATMGIMLIAGVVSCGFGGFDLPWWGVILAILLAVVSIVPIGIIQGISGQQIGLNVMSEFLIGLILPGRMIGVMAFKTVCIIPCSSVKFNSNDLILSSHIWLCLKVLC